MRHVRSGAAGVILKTVDPQLFVKCARRVTEGETWIPKKQVSTMAKLSRGAPRQPTPPRRYVDPPGEDHHQLLNAGLA